MKRLVKTLSAILLIAMCLTSDTAQSASQFQGSRFKVQESEQSSSINSFVCVANGQRLQYWEFQSLTLRQNMLLCEYLRP